MLYVSTMGRPKGMRQRVRCLRYYYGADGQEIYCRAVLRMVSGHKDFHGSILMEVL
jgi:hypothetical protein